MKHLRFIMVGGFLGAGKTTTLARLARFYLDRGQKVGLVTNDQAQDLVDTTSLRSQGFAVEEVPGACFCCRFDDLVAKVEQLQGSERPDVILAEPVGSCTDLVATVVQPLKDLYGARFEVAPIRCCSSQATDCASSSGTEPRGFSPKAAYIFRKQLEEADAIVINRIDELDSAALTELTGLVNTAFPGTPVLRLSAKTGQGFDALTELLDQQGDFGRKDSRHRLRHLRRGRGRAGLAQQQHSASPPKQAVRARCAAARCGRPVARGAGAVWEARWRI